MASRTLMQLQEFFPTTSDASEAVLSDTAFSFTLFSLILGISDSFRWHPRHLIFVFVSKAITLTTPPYHILSTNQESLSHKSPTTSGHIQLFRYGMEERFAFHFPETSSVVISSERY
ncbi:hypothetical protein TNCV_2742991 [Trichonephila clavipes]|nr:hypothetical protein TNCV_2742991 [Trichonephila clavipes]